MRGCSVDKLDRRRLLIAEALNDLLAKKTIENVTVVELCGEAGISRSTFYEYFDDIHTVGEWIWEHEVRGILEGLGEHYGYRACYERLYMRLRDLAGRVGKVRPMRDIGGSTYAQINTLAILRRRVELGLGRHLSSEEETRLEYMSCAEEAMTVKWFVDGMRVEPERMAVYVSEAAPAFVKRAVGE